MSTIQADHIIAAIIGLRHQLSQGWLCLKELRCGCGYGHGRDRTIDLWCIQASPKTNCRSVAYEVKVSSSDMLRDLKDKDKQRGAAVYSNAFYYAAPAPVIATAERARDLLPPWAGLMVVDAPENLPKIGRISYSTWEGLGCCVVRDPFPLERQTPSWPLVVSLLRRRELVIQATESSP